MSQDQGAQIAFCREEYPRLVGALTLYTGDRDLAVELAQEGLARACRHWRRVEKMRSPGAWVYRVAINLANSTFSRRRLERLARQRLGALADPVMDAPDVVALLAVRVAVAALPGRQRTAIVLRYFADLPVREVARLMRVEEGTVKALTSQGMENLRIALDAGDRSEVRDG